MSINKWLDKQNVVWCLFFPSILTLQAIQKNVRSRDKGEWWRGWIQVYLIYCKNFCKCHNVPPAQQLKKIKRRFKDLKWSEDFSPPTSNQFCSDSSWVSSNLIRFWHWDSIRSHRLSSNHPPPASLLVNCKSHVLFVVPIGYNSGFQQSPPWAWLICLSSKRLIEFANTFF
jgi:hypothetical protein